MALQINRKGFDQTGLASTRRTIQKNSKFVGKTWNLKFSSAMHEIVHEFQ